MGPNIRFLLEFPVPLQNQTAYPQPTLFLYPWEYRGIYFMATKKGKGKKGDLTIIEYLYCVRRVLSVFTSNLIFSHSPLSPESLGHLAPGP